MRSKHIYIFIIAIALCLSASAKDYSGISSEGKVTLEVQLVEQILWSVKMYDSQVLELSSVGLVFENEVLGINPKIKRSKVQEISETTQTVVRYKFPNVVGLCNELLQTFKGDYSLRFRVYNNEVFNFEGVYGGKMNKFSDKVTPAHDVIIPFIINGISADRKAGRPEI